MKLLSSSKVMLLKVFYQYPEKQFYIQELGRMLRKKPGVFQRALDSLQKDGLLFSEYKANARFFRINKKSPIYSALKSIVLQQAKMCLFFVLFSASLLFAQEQPLNLKDCILKAYKNNLDIQIQEQGIAVAKANIMDAKSNFLPHVNLEAAYTHNDKVLAETIFTGYRNDNKIGLSFNESIYNGGENLANLRQTQLGLTVQEVTLRAKKLDVEFEAKRLYYGLLLAYETEQISQDLVNQAQKHYENVLDKFKHGTASRFEVLQSKVQVTLLIPQLVNARNDIEYIKAQLNKLIGRKVDAKIETDEILEYLYFVVNEGEFLQVAYLNKPELILKNLGIDISKWSIQMAKSGYRPDINFQAGLAYESNNIGNMLNSRQQNWNAGLTVNVPIFEGFSTKAKVDAAKAQYAQAALDKTNLADQIAVDIRKGCLDVKKAESIIFSQRDSVVEAQEALRISEVSFDNGVAINLDVLDAQVSLAQVRKNLAGGIYDHLMAKAYLDRSMAISAFKEDGNVKN